ncbi:MAG: Asp-tRNA(Asn)/Glu-tRNA(Gln) amidotransferase subunit GatA [SAR202 cluster bacterium]|nr:Asp-tRNA(Asn)/Glu-tRNA(Gln) amidotransferase subunit GatA [SAR202 cluster bacterium]
MAKSDLASLTVHQARKLLDSRQASSAELTGALLDRIAAIEPKVDAYLTVTREVALKQADAADMRIAAGEAAPLTGIPLQLKDNLCTRGIPTTCSSRMLEKFVPPYDATVWQKLSSQNAVLLGKGNLDEFAMGSSTENSAFKPTRNPWDTSRVPGGSSGGPAAAAAADECLFALGSDTGGSIRQPAALCGIVGLKPTYGLVSRYGLVAFASSLDQIGPMTKDVTDSALVLNAIAGHDPCDSTSLNVPISDYTKALKPDLKGMRLGVPKEYFVQGMEPGVEKAVREAIKVLEGLGATVAETSLPHSRYALAVYYILAPSEASANLARYDGVKYGFSTSDGQTMWEAMEKTKQQGFGPEVKRRIMLGTYALSAGYYDAYYLRAQKVRTLIRQEFAKAFQEFDALVAPTSPSVAFALGAKTADPIQMYLNDVFTIPVNIAGIPAISVPAGFVDGLPVGLQFMAKHLGEETLLRAAYAYEQATEWHKHKPKL